MDIFDHILSSRIKMYKVENDTYECPVEALSNILGRKWVAEIIWGIKDNKVRFGELQRLLMENNIIINDKKTINNIIESTYYLSESGMLLLPILEKMISWGNINLSCEG